MFSLETRASLRRLLRFSDKLSTRFAPPLTASSVDGGPQVPTQKATPFRPSDQWPVTEAADACAANSVTHWLGGVTDRVLSLGPSRDKVPSPWR